MLNSPVQLGIIGLLVILLFGTKKLPELGAGLGKAISNFKRSYKDENDIEASSVDRDNQTKS